jgi:hypothetical protein
MDKQKEYKNKYYSENKVVSFPLKKYVYVELEAKSVMYDLSVNSYVKSIVTNFLNNDTSTILTSKQQEAIAEYIRISRGIANNINQIAHKTNMGEEFDTQVLLNSLQHYENEFKKFITSL